MLFPPLEDPVFKACYEAAAGAINGSETDPTEGGTYYHDTSIEFPKAWGAEGDYENTYSIGRLKFYKPKQEELPF